MPDEKKKKKIVSSEEAAQKAIMEFGFQPTEGGLPEVYQQLAWRIGEGDYPAVIVKKLYGKEDPEMVKAIVQANPDRNMKDLKVGELLILPPQMPAPGLGSSLADPELSGPPIQGIEYRPKKLTGMAAIMSHALQGLDALPKKQPALEAVLRDPKAPMNVVMGIADLSELASKPDVQWTFEETELMDQAADLLSEYSDEGNVALASEIIGALLRKSVGAGP